MCDAEDSCGPRPSNVFSSIALFISDACSSTMCSMLNIYFHSVPQPPLNSELDLLGCYTGRNALHYKPFSLWMILMYGSSK